MNDRSRLHPGAVAAGFALEGKILRIEPFGGGHINDTFKVQTGSPARPRSYLLQRINRFVFEAPERVMANIARVTAHLRAKIAAEGGDPDRETLTVVPAGNGAAWLRDGHNEYWRTFLFIEGAQACNIAGQRDQAYHAARAFGRFQRMLADVDPAELHETIPGFHNTPMRMGRLVEAVEADPCGRAGQARPEIDFALARDADCALLTDIAASSNAPLRVVHNDTKLDNVLIDTSTGKGLCVIDLDTVMPGLSMHDFGDCCRSAVNPAAEDERDLSKVRADLGLFEHIAAGFVSEAGGLLRQAELDALAMSAKILTLEQGIRFLTDYLLGDVYYRVSRPAHNLDRCRVQFALAEDMERKMDRMRRLVASRIPPRD
ncbi:MAG: phosphotransferase [Chitinivibrionales bacterium]|nr:phosphotransferase [Chitinivibrionales bacterium]MBD3395793.1 phosphotransferase [Chitinivibrionales bacterium]